MKRGVTAVSRVRGVSTAIDERPDRVDHIGLRYAATCDVIMEDVRVPIDAVLGGREGLHRGWPMLAGPALDVEKLEITACAYGIAAAAVEDAVPALQQGGRLVYAGAGTSGRIGVQDGTELSPTFDWPAERLVFAMAGGLGALLRSAEQAEDSEAAGAQAITDSNIAANDVIVGVAASGTTPFTIGALRAATAAGAVTIAVASNPGAPLFEVARHRILLDTGSEVIAGSTRMKAGTAQKLALNMISTAVMIQLGRVKGNKMVDMQLTNDKLIDRGTRMVMEELGVAQDVAEQLLKKHGSVRKAIAEKKNAQH